MLRSLAPIRRNIVIGSFFTRTDSHEIKFYCYLFFQRLLNVIRFFTLDFFLITIFVFFLLFRNEKRLWRGLERSGRTSAAIIDRVAGSRGVAERIQEIESRGSAQRPDLYGRGMLSEVVANGGQQGKRSSGSRRESKKKRRTARSAARPILDRISTV